MKNIILLTAALTFLASSETSLAGAVPCSEAPDCSPPNMYDNGTPDDPEDDLYFEPGCSITLVSCTRTDSEPGAGFPENPGNKTFESEEKECDACDNDPATSKPCGPWQLTAKFTETETLTIDPNVITGKAAVENALKTAHPADGGPERKFQRNCSLNTQGGKKEGVVNRGTAVHEAYFTNHEWECTYNIGTKPNEQCGQTGNSQTVAGGTGSSSIDAHYVDVNSVGCVSSEKSCPGDEEEGGGTE